VDAPRKSRWQDGKVIPCVSPPGLLRAIQRLNNQFCGAEAALSGRNPEGIQISSCDFRAHREALQEKNHPIVGIAATTSLSPV
jgi:hypothetical protein